MKCDVRTEKSNGNIMILRGVAYNLRSTCGHVHVAYLPSEYTIHHDEIIKIIEQTGPDADNLDTFVTDIANMIDKMISPQGVSVMAFESGSPSEIVSLMRGVFKTERTIRLELLNLLMMWSSS